MDGWLRIGVKAETKQFDKQIEKLESDLKAKKGRLEAIMQLQAKGFKVKGFSKDIKTLQADIEKTSNSILDLKRRKQELEKGRSINLRDSFESAFKSAKRLVMGIIGVRSAYFLIRKASSAYLQSDTATTQQLENNWIGVGSLMQEIITGIVSAMKKLVTAVLYFAQQLTGVNYIARANANILKKQTKETNGLAKANDKLTASFDEMNTLQSKESYGGVSGGGIDESSLFDINDLSEDARKAIEKIGKVLKPVYDMIKDIIGWALENPEAIIGILGGFALLSFLGKVLGIAGGGASAGLLGIQGVLLGIASIGVITISIITVYKTVKEAREEMKKTEEGEEDLTKQSIRLTNETKKATIGLKKEDDAVRNISSSYYSMSKRTINLAESKRKLYNEMNPLEALIHAFDEELGEMETVYAENIKQTYFQLKAWGHLYEQGLLNEEETQNYKETLIKLTEELEKSGYSMDDYSGSIYLNTTQAQGLVNIYKDCIKTTETLGIKASGTSALIGGVAGSMRDVQAPSKKTNEILKIMNDYMQGLINKKDVKLRIEADTYGARQALMNLTEGLPTFLKTTLRASFGNIKLAQGGIVNNPGRGVPIGSNVIAGEAGPEAVLPLDSETLGTLGKMIADNMVVNLTTINKMDGRVLSREMQRVNANNDFAFNK